MGFFAEILLLYSFLDFAVSLKKKLMNKIDFTPSNNEIVFKVDCGLDAHACGSPGVCEKLVYPYTKNVGVE